MALGEYVNYVVTYENTGQVDAQVSLMDIAIFSESNSSFAYIDSEFSVECDSQNSTVECIPFEQGDRTADDKRYLVSKYYVLPAGKKLVVNAKIRVPEDVCLKKAGDILINNTASMDTSMRNPHTGSWVPFTEDSVTSASVTARVRCVDVSTTSSVLDRSPVPGGGVRIVSEVSNSVGYGESVPFELVLPKTDNGLNVLYASGVTPVCEVVSGQGICPTSYSYDRASNKITGVIEYLGHNSSLRFTTPTVFTSDGRFNQSYRVYTRSAPVPYDVRMGSEGVNESSDTFTWIDYLDTEIPPTPQINDLCGLNNARWVKPEDTDTVRWELQENGRRILAHAKDGYKFEGENNKFTHDYGIAKDSNTPCVIDVPVAPTVDDQCGPSNARWVKPEDSDAVRWELGVDGRLVAYTREGFKFRNGDGVDKTSHDYGVAHDSNEVCPVDPPNTNLDTEPGGEPGQPAPGTEPNAGGEPGDNPGGTPGSDPGQPAPGGDPNTGGTPGTNPGTEPTLGNPGIEPGGEPGGEPGVVVVRSLPNTGFDAGFIWGVVVCFVVGVLGVLVRERRGGVCVARHCRRG